MDSVIYMDKNTAAIAHRVDAARREQGVAILPLSDATGIPYTTLQAFLAGKRDMLLSRVVAVTRELNLSPDAYMHNPAVTIPAQVAA